jgi:hypothetical protein
MAERTCSTRGGKVIVDYGPQIATSVINIINAAKTGSISGSGTGTYIVNEVSSGLKALYPALQSILGQAKDRPIGLAHESGDNYKFSPLTVILTDTLVARISQTSLGPLGPGFIPVVYTDDARIGSGSYTLWLKVAVLVPQDARLYREWSSALVYFIQGGAKFVADPTFLSAIVGETTVVPDGALRPIPSIPRNGMLLRELSHTSVYLIENGTKRWVPDNETLNPLGGWHQVNVVPDGGLVQVPSGDPLPSSTPSSRPLGRRVITSEDLANVLASVNRGRVFTRPDAGSPVIPN